VLGLKFRLHPRKLPGKPDLVFPDHKFALFVHGCFWHRHPGCPKATAPSSAFWRTKFKTNVERDRRVTKELKKAGWRVAVIWECQTKDPIRMTKKIEKMIFKKTKKNARTKVRARSRKA
jgi:DNA mismatch endonuclease (patch repair protein)